MPPDEHRAAGTRFTWAMTAFSGWLVAGLYLEGWAHNHRRLDIPLFSSQSGGPCTCRPGP